MNQIVEESNESSSLICDDKKPEITNIPKKTI